MSYYAALIKKNHPMIYQFETREEALKFGNSFIEVGFSSDAESVDANRYMNTLSNYGYFSYSPNIFRRLFRGEEKFAFQVIQSGGGKFAAVVVQENRIRVIYPNFTFEGAMKDGIQAFNNVYYSSRMPHWYLDNFEGTTKELETFHFTDILDTRISVVSIVEGLT